MAKCPRMSLYMLVTNWAIQMLGADTADLGSSSMGAADFGSSSRGDEILNGRGRILENSPKLQFLTYFHKLRGENV